MHILALVFFFKLDPKCNFLEYFHVLPFSPNYQKNLYLYHLPRSKMFANDLLMIELDDMWCDQSTIQYM